MSDETRKRILDYFSKNYSASTLDLSRILGLTKPDIHYHIKIMMEDGVIEKIPLEPADHAGRGRPTIRYRLTEEYYPNNLYPLLKAVLNVGISSCKLPVEKEKYINMIAVELVGTHRATGSLTQSLSQSLVILNLLNYQAHWEAHRDGPKIIFRNCPYRTMVDEYPELCLMDASLLELILDGRVIKTSHIQDDDLITPSCIFRFKDSRPWEWKLI